MDWTIMLALLHIVFQLICVKWVLCVDLHIFYNLENSLTEPKFVFNASNGRGWSYHIDRGFRGGGVSEIIVLDASSGSVYLHEKNICHHLMHNPIDIRIIAKSNFHDREMDSLSSYTQTPLTIYLYDLPCRVPIHRKVQQYMPANVIQVIIFSNQFSNWNNFQCIEKDKVLLHLNDNIPYSLKDSIICDVSVEDSDFTYNPRDSSISTNSVQCLQQSKISVPLKLIACAKFYQNPFFLKINIHDTKSLDNTFTLVEHVKDQNRQKRSTYVAPVFPKTEYNTSIAENLPAGQTVILITATDADEGEAGTVTYRLDSIRDSRSIDMFSIDPISGMVKTLKPLDREIIPQHEFKVTATDSSPYQKSASAILIVSVNDENDLAPTFAQTIYKVEKTENLPVASTITTVRATDGDAGKNREIRYSIIKPSNPTTFKIDPIIGSISTLRVLDREVAANYQLVVQAIDQAPFGQQKSSTATINIKVLDENDNFPQFDQDSYMVNVSENLDISNKPVIGHVSATDADEGINRDITYSITGGQTDSTFYIDPTTGEVSVQKPLDYEKQPDFRLKIKASDNGETAKTNSTTMWIRIDDLNDNAPYFQSSVYLGSIPENEDVGTSVLTVHALDKDSGVNRVLEYSLLEVPAGLPFAIEQDTGKIVVRARLDREIQASYQFTVQVKDKGQPPLSATASVEISIRDINDNSPIFSQKTFSISLSENTQLYKQVLQVTANDADIGENAILTYVIISGNNDQVFTIGRDLGIITLAKNLDYKIQNRYILTIRASDQDDRFDTAEVHINVTDINKHTPTFENAPYQLNVDEGDDVGTSVGKVHASDSDVGENGRITYELLNDVEDFSIDPDTGVITTREVLDREMQPAYSFDVKASDNGNPKSSDTAGVTIVVNDKNDNAPTFEKSSYEASVSEAAFDGHLVLNVHADDTDDGINSQIQYSFADGSDGIGDFEVDSTNGDIRVAIGSKIDREKRNNYTLTIIAVDKGFIPLTGSVEVKIKIEDINDNAPVFPSDEITVLVPENKRIGSTVAVITAVDPDEGVNAVVEYSFEGGLDADKFKLKIRPGDPAIIVNIVNLDYESDKKEYEILLKAVSENLFSLALIKIQVQDVNDNQPILKDFNIVFNNFVDHFPTVPIGRIPAFDPDVSDQDKLQYKFLLGNEMGFLQLNESTGEITLDSRLNSDVPRNGTLQVKVSDGLNEVRATCRLYVRLVTAEMLQHSVTIRINNMTTSAFLSPLFTFFVDALATIINIDKNNIFVINVRNDTDVLGQILNVTVSVREKSEKVDREMVDYFYSAEFLKEQIYLQRTLLANLSTLQILPFDDNMCIREMCADFEMCVSWVKYGEPAPFIASDTMLFRPIYPANGYKCKCPDKGYTSDTFSYLCNVEIDLCYSNPCNNAGTCHRREGGYTCQCDPGHTGEHCEVDLSMKYDTTLCPSDVCQEPSKCQPLIEGGFRCNGCPNQDDYNQFCQLTTRSFPKGSFLMFPALKARYRFIIKLRFATQQKNGLLFYNGRFNELNDFIALEIVDGQVQFSFSTGSTHIIKTSPYIEGGVNDGKWHLVTVNYLNLTATVTVGEDCDTEISVRFGKPINYTCAARQTLVHNPNCSLPATRNCQKLLDLAGPLQVGGLPSLPSAFQIQNKDYIGCIKDFYIDEKLLDFNTWVANNGTQPGCKAKQEHCKMAPCQHGGTCVEGWGTYKCSCPDGWGGIDCSHVIDRPRTLSGTGYLHYSNVNQLIPRVHVKWYNGVSFRTRSFTGTLLYIISDMAETIHVQLIDGYISYTYTNSLTPQVFLFDSVAVNDGLWHDFEARWLLEDGNIVMVLDYGQRMKTVKVQSTLAQKPIQDVYIGARKIGSEPLENNFVGCVKNIRVGNTQTSILQGLQANNAPEGCSSQNSCNRNPCNNSRAECVNEWEGFSCTCPPGTLGPSCDNICTSTNPCQNMAYCHHPQGGSYECECGEFQSGKYCEVSVTLPCPAKWWGSKVCGPCPAICTAENGFEPNCDKLTGECSCLANYYKPVGSDICLPCNCYGHGSENLSCDSVTGQCPCIEGGVIGRRCDQCTSKYAEIRQDEKTHVYSCRVDYEACPRIFSNGMWWDTKVAGVMITQDCPNRALGQAQRNCSADGLWQDPDFFNCTNPAFLEHNKQINKIESGALQINTFVAKTMVASLADSTSTTETMFGNDINITLRIITRILNYENLQSGLNLTSEQDSRYLTNIITILSDVFQSRYKQEWSRLNQEGEGAKGLIAKLEKYLSTLLYALQLTSQQSPRPYNVVTDNIVVGVDTINKNNFSGKTIPKYDNIVKGPIFDEDTNIRLPQSVITPPQLPDFLQPEIVAPPKAFVGYIMYRYLGDLLPQHYGAGVRVIPDRPMSVNSPVFTILLHDNDEKITSPLADPVILTFKQELMENRTSPQCVFWDNSSSGGEWSSRGCEESDRYELDKNMYVKCSCNHMTSFAVLMDISNQEYVAPEPIGMEVITFVGLIVCMGCLAISFVIFFCLKRLWCNATSIHSNLVLVMFISQLAFLTGINRTDNELFCRLIAIALHYFFMTGFSWLIVDILHIYRMFTEIRNIDQGSMKFYYLIAYVIPGIIVSLAVGLNTEGYGNTKFCWLLISDKFIWSFAGPVTVAVIINIFAFVISVKASCREKVSVSDLSSLRFSLFANIIILMLWGIVWVVGLLAVNYSYAALHYVYAILSLALGVFIFIIYVLANSKVRLELKKLWYKCQGKKLDLDDNIAGTRSSVYSRSALAYNRNDSCDGGLARINVGISTTSTTSRSTSKSSGGLYKGEDYLRSTSTSTSGNIPPMKYPNNGLPPPYGYDPEKPDDLDPDSIQIRPKRDANDSDSDSEMSERVSLDLASSHSSDDDDDIDVQYDWEKQLPKNKKIEYQELLYHISRLVPEPEEEAKEQARMTKKDDQLQQNHQQQQQQNEPQPQQYHQQQLPQLQHTYQNPFEALYSGTPPPALIPKPHTPGQWPGDPQLGYNGSDSEYRSSDQPTLSSIQPDVTLQTPEYKGREFRITPPTRTDSLLNDSSSANKGPLSSPYGSPHLKHHTPRESPSSPIERLNSPHGSPRVHMTVKVLTHRGSVSSDSECSHETCV